MPLTKLNRPRTRKRKHVTEAEAVVPPPKRAAETATAGRPDYSPPPHSRATYGLDLASHRLSSPAEVAEMTNLSDTTQPDLADPIPLSSSPEEAPWTTAKVGFEKYYDQDIFPSTASRADDNGVAEVDMIALRLYKAFDIPSQVWTTSLLENWNSYVHPLMPIVQRRWLVAREGYKVPVVLLKSVLLAGARTSGAPDSFPCDEYYRALRTLIYCQYEKNPIINIVAACLLGWYNQSSTWTVAHDSSRTWLHFASNLAYQIGLHQESKTEAHSPYKRRLWWTLVARDCQVASGTGRPRILNLKYSNRRLISVKDFEPGDREAPGFVAYVRISLILGDLWNSYQLGRLPSSVHQEIRNRLVWWIRELPLGLRYFTARDGEDSFDNFVVRQLHCIYLACVALLCKTDWPTKTVSPVALVASSYMVSLMEGFLARNEFSRLPAITTFYVLSAAIPHLAVRKYSSLRAIVGANLQIFDEALVTLSRRWPSSAAALKHYMILKEMQPRITAANVSRPLPTICNANDLLLFEDFTADKCNLWAAIVKAQVQGQGQDDLAVQATRAEAVESILCPSTPEMPFPARAGGGNYMGYSQNQILEASAPVWVQRGAQHGQIPGSEFHEDLTFGLPNTIGGWLFADDTFKQQGLDYLELL